MGTHWTSPGLGIAIDSPIDPDRPTLRGVVAGGASHYVQDLGLLFDGLAGAGQPAVQEAVDAAVLEMWTSPDRLVMDTSGYQPLADLDPTYDFGPFAPGVWFVDLATFVELGREEIVGFIIGNGAGDPSGLASRIGDVLRDVDRTAEDTLTGTTTYGEFLAATGQNVETVSRGIAGGLALNLRVDVDVLTGVLVQIYAATPVSVTVVTTETGELRGIRTLADFSDIFTQMFADETLAAQLSAGEAAQVERLFAETDYTIETVTAYEIDPALTVPPAPESTDDRTDQVVAFLKQSGLL